jgi:hypothetical protein
MSDRFLQLTQRMVVGREEVLARRWQVRLSDTAARERRAYERALAVRPGRGRAVIALLQCARGEWKYLGMPTKRLVSLRAAIAGGTGTGKSSWLIGVLLQILLEGRYPVILYDAKGETADAVLDDLVPFLLESGVGDEFLGRLRVVKVFDRQYVPLLNLTRAQKGVPKEAQAYAVASAFEQALAEPLGGRMHHVLVRLVSLCIEQGWPLTRVQEWLENPSSFVRAAGQSSDVALREYAHAGFKNENKESLRALAARLNALLFWPGARLALCAPGAISFSDALAEPGLTVVHTGSPPAGAERLSRFFGAALLGQIVRELLDREVGQVTPPALFVAEEIQESLGPEEARQLGRLLATARYKREAVWLTNQSRSQIHAVDPGLVAAMRANVELHVQFRSSPEDAAAFAYMLPQEQKGEAARRELINSLARLPQRHCYLAVRDLGLRAQLVLAPRIDFDALRERIQRGIASLPREEVLRQMSAESPVPMKPEVNDPPAMPVAKDDESFPALG